MALTVTHAFVSALADDPGAAAAGEILPQSHWNAQHTLSGVVGVSQGGTGITTGVQGGLLYFSSTNTISSTGSLPVNAVVLGGDGSSPTTVSGLGTTTQVLHGNAAGAPTWGAVNLATDITGNLALSNLPTIPNNTVLGNNTGSTGAPVALTATQAALVIALFTATAQGVVPASGGGTANFLRADGAWAVPPGTGGGGAPGGSNTQLQYNNAGTFGGITGATTNGVNTTFASGALILSGATSGSATLNAPATGGGTITLPVGTTTLAGLGTTQTFTANNTFSSTVNHTGPFQVNGNVMTFPVIAATLAGLGVNETWTGTQTFNNATLVVAGATSGTTTLNASATASGTLTFPATTDTLVARNTTDTLQNKTLTNTNNTLGAVTAGFGSDATGDVYYRNAGGQITRLGIGTANQVLTVVAGLPSWTTGGGGTISGSGTTGQVTTWASSSSLAGDVGMTYAAGGQLTLALGTITTNNKALNITGTWNAGGVTFDAPIFVNITDTASAAASLLIDLQVGGSTKFSVNKSGNITGQNFTSTLQGLVPLSGGGTTNFLRADGTWAAPAGGGGGTPGGANTNVQFNNAGAFGGDAGFTYAGNGQVTHALGTITVNQNALTITGTWNAATVATTGASGTGTTATLTFAAQTLAYPVGSTIVVAGVTPAGYNGTYTVTASTTTSVSYASATTGAQTVAGTVQQLFDAPLFMNVTNTASAAVSKLMDLQVGGSSVFNVSPTGATISSPTVTTSQPALSVSQTWNAAGVAFTGVSIVISDSTSNFASKLFSVTGSAANFFVRKDGYNVGGGTGFVSASFNTGMTNTTLVNGEAFQIGYSQSISWSSSNDITQSRDLFILRDAAGTLAQRNLANAQTFRVYNTTDAPVTNYERGVFDWTTSANVLTIGTQKGGTGATRPIQFQVGSVNQIGIATGSEISGNQSSSGGLNLTPTSGALNVEVSNSSLNFWVSGNLIMDVNRAGSSRAFRSTSPGYFSLSNNTTNTNPDVTWYRVATAVWGVGTSATNTLGGWLQWAGEARVTSDFSATSNITLANVTGLSVSLAAGRTYSFHIALFFATGATAGGIQVALGGTATVTNLIADGSCLDASTVIPVTRVSALGSALIANTNAGTTPKAVIEGTFTVNAAGTLTVQFAQNVSNATASTVKQGSYMWVHDMP